MPNSRYSVMVNGCGFSNSCSAILVVPFCKKFSSKIRLQWKELCVTLILSLPCLKVRGAKFDAPLYFINAELTGLVMFLNESSSKLPKNQD